MLDSNVINYHRSQKKEISYMSLNTSEDRMSYQLAHKTNEYHASGLL